MQAIVRLKRGSRRNGIDSNGERYGIQQTHGNRASPANPNDEHGPFPKNARSQVDLHGYQAQDESPVARIEPDGQRGESPRTKLDAAGGGLTVHRQCHRQTAAREQQAAPQSAPRRPSSRRQPRDGPQDNQPSQRRIATVDEVAIDVNAVCVQRNSGKPQSVNRCARSIQRSRPPMRNQSTENGQWNEGPCNWLIGAED